MSVIVPDRFDETAQPQWWADRRHLVRCPRCGRQATVDIVALGEFGWPWEARIACVHCGFADDARSDAPRWRGPVIVSARARCGRCGREVGRAARRQASSPRRADAVVTCPGCSHRTRVPLRVERADCREPVDPYFGVALWLQTSCCGEILWANEGHLTFLANYVGAALRERKPNVNRSAVSRLPSWMKQAKNRAAILECIEHLRRTLVEAELRAPFG